jgi:hypothetical protein
MVRRLKLVAMKTVAALTLLLATSACTRLPRWQETSDSGGRRLVTIRAPLLTGDHTPDLELVSVFTGENLAYDPPLWLIYDLSTDPDGFLYVSDAGHGHILVLDATGNVVSTIGRRGPGPFEFNNKMSPIQSIWVSKPRLLVTSDVLRFVVFNREGDPRPSGWKQEFYASMASSSTEVILSMTQEHPFVPRSPLGQIEGSAFGRPLGPEDTRWKGVAEAIARIPDVRSSDGTRHLPPSILPDAIACWGDSLLVHNLVFRDGYRGWNRYTGEEVWEIHVDTGTYEPPTLYRFSTTVSSPLSSWSRSDPPRIHHNSRVISIVVRDDLMFAFTRLTGDGKHSKPDRKRVANAWTAGQELDGSKPIRLGIDIISSGIDLIAHLEIPMEQGISDADVLPGPTVVVSTNNPQPAVRYYRITGLPRGHLN